MVSISLVINSGIITKSKSAVDKYSEEEIGEQIKLAYQEWQMGQFTTSINIENKLKEIFGSENVSDVTFINNKLKAIINNKKFKYDITTGKVRIIKEIDYGDKTKETVAKDDDIQLGTEKFKVISNSNGVIKAMPYYNIEIKLNNPIQSSSAGTIQFSTDYYWEKSDYAINMNDNRNNIQKYINAYKETLENLGADEINVRVARASDLNVNGITNDIRNPGQTGEYWVGSGHVYGDNYVTNVNSSGGLDISFYNNSRGIRPVIIIEY